MTVRTRHVLVGIARTLGVAGFVLGLLGVLWAHNDDVSRSSAARDATLPCSQALHPRANVLCILGAELDRRAAARDTKEAKAAKKTRDDVCVVLAALPPSKGTTALRRDLGCLASTPAPTSPGTTTTVVVPAPPTGKPSPVPTTTPPRTGTPTPSATRSGGQGARPSPTASQTPTPRPSASCGLLARLTGGC